MEEIEDNPRFVLVRLVLAFILASAVAGCTAGGENVTDGAGTQQSPPAETTGTSGSGEKAAAETSVGEKGRRNLVSEEVEDMSVREMVGQVFVVSVSGTEPDYYIEKMIRERNIGGVLLFGYNMQNEAQTRSLVSSLQGLARETEPPVPLFVAVDQEGGEVSSAPWITPQPPAAEVGARGNPAEARRVAEQMGRELAQAGINTNFAPVFDTGFGAAIGSRSYGEEPGLVSRMGVAAMEGFQRAGLVTSAKHFPNHGVAGADSHTELPVVDHGPETIETYDLPPFEAAVEAGVPMVMVGHLIYPAIDPNLPTSLSPEAIQLLRKDLGFEGVVVTDDLSMAAALRGGSPAGAAVAAVKAGADLLILSGIAQEQADVYGAVVSAVESGEIPERQIERSAERIVKVKRGHLLYEQGTD